MYEYNAKLIRVIDGDTVDASIDLGFDVWVKKRIRLHGIDAPESRTRDLEEKKGVLPRLNFCAPLWRQIAAILSLDQRVLENTEDA